MTHNELQTTKDPFGVIDIGSNTVLLTCGKKTPDGSLKILLEEHEVARLSRGLQDGGQLHPEARQSVLEVLGKFQEKAKEHGIDSLMGAGTSAFRRAADGQEFAEEIENSLNIPVRILSGEEEAHYSYLSAKLDFGSDHPSLGMIDIGGGSTELVFGEKAGWISLPIGTVRLLEKYVTTHPIPDKEWEVLQNEIQSVLRRELDPEKKIPSFWVAVAATPTALANLLQGLPHYEPQRVHGYRISRRDLSKIIETLRRASVKERNAMAGMPPKRAELLPLGGLILKEVMEYLDLEEVVTSDHGLRYGYLYHLLRGKRDY